MMDRARLDLVSYGVLSKLEQVQSLVHSSPRINVMILSKMHVLVISRLQKVMFGIRLDMTRFTLGIIHRVVRRDVGKCVFETGQHGGAQCRRERSEE